MDTKDHFFERVTLTEMEIQMKTEKHYTNREECVKDYIAFMKNDVEHFTEEEISKITPVMNEINEMLEKVNPALIHQDIILIKTKANHYGSSVYYTRENKIIIPNNEIRNFNATAFKEVMLHELFHILSRYNPELRDKLYQLIGFSPVNGPIIYPESLGKRKLLNPDGTTDYLIKLKNKDGENIIAYPLITANEDHYTKSKKAFFNYLDFHLYQLIPGEDNVYSIKLNEDQSTTIPFEKIPSFFASIKDNTNYIIHPDEIMADNFIYTITYLADKKELKKFSEEGKKLIEDVGALLKEF
jgi:hypothetical protein